MTRGNGETENYAEVVAQLRLLAEKHGEVVEVDGGAALLFNGGKGETS